MRVDRSKPPQQRLQMDVSPRQNPAYAPAVFFKGCRMNVNPLDLQVLFSKTLDLQAVVQKESAIKENIQHVLTTNTTQASRDAPEVVKNTEDYAEEFTKVDKDGTNSSQQQTAGHQKESSDGNTDNEKESHGGLIDELSGHHVDIID